MIYSSFAMFYRFVVHLIFLPKSDFTHIPPPKQKNRNLCPHRISRCVAYHTSRIIPPTVYSSRQFTTYPTTTLDIISDRNHSNPDHNCRPTPFLSYTARVGSSSSSISTQITNECQLRNPSPLDTTTHDYNPASPEPLSTVPTPPSTNPHLMQRLYQPPPSIS